MVDGLVFEELKNNELALWNLLLASGYLTFSNLALEERAHFADLKIPNQELLYLYETTVRGWFRRFTKSHYSDLLRCLIEATPARLAEFATSFALIAEESFSFFDVGDETTPERFYHAFVLGLLIDLRKEYRLMSDREGGAAGMISFLYPTINNAPALYVNLSVSVANRPSKKQPLRRCNRLKIVIIFGNFMLQGLRE